ncbi:MAG: MerR family transcriptional regulator [Myxococcota bacterium]|nr:MerR family transcriptional regulator [Myxococcota bacterium]
MVAKLLPITKGVSSGQKKSTYRIGDLAKRINKSTRALRLYEEMNLLGSVTRNEGGQRIYDEEVFARLTWIEKLQSLGFSLLQIQSVLSNWIGNEYGPAGMKEIRQIYRAKLEETQLQIRQLESLSEDLRESLTYLESCEVCDPCTLLGACAECAHPHSTSSKPALVTGLYSVSEAKKTQTDN